MTVSEAIEVIDIQVDPSDQSPSDIRAIRFAFNTIRPNIIEWYPYPQEEPIKEGYYLLTLKNNDAPLEIDAWSMAHGWNYFAPVEVLAWAEFPNAYEPSEDDLNKST